MGSRFRAFSIPVDKWPVSGGRHKMLWARASAGVAFLATILIFGGMVLRGRLTAWALLLGGPLYLVYLYLALFTDLGRSAV